MMLSPAWASVLMVMNWALWPDEAARAAAPPSRAAIRFSKTSTVGYAGLEESCANKNEVVEERRRTFMILE